MRLRRLTFQAIGPFAGHHTINFDQLALSGLFLLCGPTGSGKSTIIDAITFALYGSQGAMTERLHSAHAAPGVEPFVELTFETGSGLYRVRQSPAHERPKQRGAGTTTENAQARLFRLTSEDQIGLDGAGEPVASKPQEALPELARIIGLSREQFTQTIVLPQGQFAGFLHAKPDERRDVLQQIFATDIYDRTQKQLKERELAAERRIQATRAEVSAAAGALWPETERPPSWEDADLGALLTEAEALVERKGGEAASAEEARDAAVRASQAARTRLEEARALRGLLDRRSAALRKRAELEERASSIDASRTRLRHAQAVSSLRASFVSTDAALAAAEKAALAAEKAREDAAAVLTDTPPEELGTLRDRLLSRVETLRTAHSREVELIEGEKSLGELAEAEEGAAARLSEVSSRLAEIPGRRSALQDLAGKAAAAAERLPGLQQRETSLAALHEKALRLEETRGERATAEEQRTGAVSAAREASGQEHRLREEWIGQMAGELATGLHDGDPCPVCGSLTHPRPAERADGAATRQDVDRAHATTVATEEALTEIVSRVSKLDARARELETDLSGRTAEELAAELGAARARLAEDTSTAETARGVRAGLGELDDLEKQLTASRTEAAGELERHRERRAGLDGALVAARAEVGRARGEHASVAEVLRLAEADLESIERVRLRMAEAGSAHATHTTALRSLRTACEGAGFESVEAARSALMAPAELEALAEEIRAVDDDRATAAATLAEGPIAALTGDEVADVPGLEQAAREAAAAENTAASDAGGSRHAHGEAQARLTSLRAAVRRLTEAKEAAAPLLRMSRIAAGENSSRLPLASYVLLRRFEEVVRAANLRLTSMSDGRYELRRTDEREGGTRSLRRGLALEVMDYGTGQVRSPRSLSGGETFYTSLALALGLADVVSDESGGIRLGTLFVDEGFGTLDADTLGNVMGVLESLSAGGRAVGIVSHVADLRSQIHEQIQVSHRAGGGGSDITVYA